jgi:hypothetical protein
MVRLAAQTRVWCDRGRVILPRSGGAVSLADAGAGGVVGPTMLSEGTSGRGYAPV